MIIIIIVPSGHHRHTFIICLELCPHLRAVHRRGLMVSKTPAGEMNRWQFFRLVEKHTSEGAKNSNQGLEKLRRAGI